MSVSPERDNDTRHAQEVSEWICWSAVDLSLSFIESRLTELAQRDLTRDQVKRLGRIMAKAETEILRRGIKRWRSAA